MDKIKLFFLGFFDKVMKAFKELLAEALPIARQIVMAQLKSVAEKAVDELDKSTLSNEEKRKEAFKRIYAYSKEKGIEAKESLINALIEIVVLKFRKG